MTIAASASTITLTVSSADTAAMLTKGHHGTDTERSDLMERARVGGAAAHLPAQRAARRPSGRHRLVDARPGGHPCATRPARPARAASPAGACAGGAARSGSATAPAGRGSMPARQRASSTSRLPMPATTDWSMRRAFTGRAARPEDVAKLRRVEVERVGAEAVLVGIEQHAAEAPWITDPQLSPTVETDRDPIPLGVLPHARVLEVLDVCAPSTSRRPVMPKRSPIVGP